MVGTVLPEARRDSLLILWNFLWNSCSNEIKGATVWLEDIHDRQYAPPGITAAPLRAQVDVTELMGNEIFVYLLTGQKSFIARVDPRTQARIGQDLDIAVNMDNVHIFDRQTERAIR